MSSKRKIGLVLAGGGGKGAYELGVWKYLSEIGLTKKISVISGTSVGALNAVLLSLCDYETAEWIWTTRLKEKILDTKSKKKKEWAKYSRDGLLKIIDANVNLDKLSSLKRKIYATCLNITNKNYEYFCLNDYNKMIIKKLLCATSAIPIAFRREKINGSIYFDGGLFNIKNVPLDPLVDEGCTDAIIVNLDRNYHVDYSNYKIRTIVIHPTENLGGKVKGTLGFSFEHVKPRIDLGYLDCKITYEPILKSLCDSNKKGIIDLKVYRAETINKMDDRTIFLSALEKIVEDPWRLGKIQRKDNCPLSILLGKGCWDNLVEYNGWRFQKNKVTKYVRLTDPQNECRVWGRQQQMVNLCRDLLFYCL